MNVLYMGGMGVSEVIDKRELTFYQRLSKGNIIG